MPFIEVSRAFIWAAEVSNVPSVVHEQKRPLHCKITIWISSTAFATQQFDIISQRQKGSGTVYELIDSPRFPGRVHGSNQTHSYPSIAELAKR